MELIPSKAAAHKCVSPGFPLNYSLDATESKKQDSERLDFTIARLQRFVFVFLTDRAFEVSEYVNVQGLQNPVMFDGTKCNRKPARPADLAIFCRMNWRTFKKQQSMNLIQLVLKTLSKKPNDVFQKVTYYPSTFAAQNE
jgi:hypothetical protein